MSNILSFISVLDVYNQSIAQLESDKKRIQVASRRYHYTMISLMIGRVITWYFIVVHILSALMCITSLLANYIQLVDNNWSRASAWGLFSPEMISIVKGDINLLNYLLPSVVLILALIILYLLNAIRLRLRNRYRMFKLKRYRNNLRVLRIEHEIGKRSARKSAILEAEELMLSTDLKNSLRTLLKG